MADAPEDAPAAETRDCKYCSRSLGCDSYVLKQWQKPGPPCCIACAAERSAAGDEAASRGEPTAALANEPTALRAQVEFYLSDKNLRRDAFYRSRIEASDGGWLPLAEILGAPRVAASGASAAELVGALEPSTSVELRIDAEVDADGGGCFVRRRGGRALPQLGGAAGGGGGGAPASKKRRAISQPFAAAAPTIAALVVDDAEAEQRRKRAARFEAAAARPPPPPPQRSFAWSGGKMSTNREEATEAFLERVSRGETAELSAEQRAAIARVADS